MPLQDEHIEVLVCAILSVNSYAYEKAHGLMPSLRVARLLDASHVTSLDLGPLTVALYNAGYDRGMLTSRIAERLQGLMRSVRGGLLDDLPGYVAKPDEASALAVLQKVPGVGPKVARIVWTLLRAASTGGS